MNKADSLKCISWLSDIIGLLEGKWKRPHTDLEAKIIQQISEVRETIRAAYEAEQEPIDPEVAAIAKQYLEEMLSGTTCPVCHQPITEERQVGRCVYGIPCWHRMYQGTAKPKPEKIHPYFQEQLDREAKQP